MSKPPETLVGFGFGAIQAGLFAYEAFRSGNFQRLVVAEVVPEVVEAIRRAGGNYRVNIAGRSGVQVHEVRGVEILNPTVPEDARVLEQALAEASEIATALPSVAFYQKGEASVAGFIARALARKATDERLPRCVVYTAENDNRAAEILFNLCQAEWSSRGFHPSGSSGHPDVLKAGHHTEPTICSGGQILNTVIGKMSGVVTEPQQIASEKLAPLADGLSRAILVEEFNRILITQIEVPGFKRGIRAFVEKPDLLPFEEAKLYGHNAVHALLGYLARRQGCRFISEAGGDAALMALAREAFVQESGAALISRYDGLDPLFTLAGYRDYAEDLLTRMTNLFLRDSIERVTRDTRRKLGWNDRLIGTMRLCLDTRITPRRFAIGAAAALETLVSEGNTAELLNELWPVPEAQTKRKLELIQLIKEANKN